ncbi:MAG: SPW repeat protein [Candidatus Moranbacteria bacterium]|nr:SPW repeat protein [Candidatus Moranbacteria bacterium]
MKTNKSKVAGSISLIAGLWLALSALFMGFGLISNAFIVGALIAIAGVIELNSVEATTSVSWINGILGAWLLVSPMFLAGLTMSATWNSVILGLIVLGTAVYGGSSSSSSIGMGHPKMG